MEIRKLFKFEMGHIVRNAWSRRCSRNAHGHSYVVEMFFDGCSPDNGQMVTDFGFIKKYIHPFVDSFDHSFWIWDRPEDQHIKEFFQAQFERVLVSPWSTTAEMQAKMFYVYAKYVILYLTEKNKFENGENQLEHGCIIASRARVHETTTGWGEYKIEDEDIDGFPDIDLSKLTISEGIRSEWPREFANFYDNELLPFQQELCNK